MANASGFSRLAVSDGGGGNYSSAGDGSPGASNNANGANSAGGGHTTPTPHPGSPVRSSIAGGGGTSSSSGPLRMIYLHGHSFGKKTFHRPVTCHFCSELLWGQGYVCEGEHVSYVRHRHRRRGDQNRLRVEK